MLRVILFVGAMTFSVFAGEPTVTPSLAKELEPFRPLLGKTWKGEFVGGKADKPMHDVLTFERILNGRAIRALHSVNEGVYGGETLIIWNPHAKRIETFYFTTGGDRSEGTMTPEKDGFTSIETFKPETPSDDPANVTQARAVTKLLSDGRLHVKSEYLRKAGWQPGHEIIYSDAPGAKVVFK